MARPGERYLLQLSIQPVDGSVGNVVTQSIGITVSDFAMDSTTPYFAAIGDRQHFQGRDIQLARGDTLFGWTATAQGFQYPDLTFDYPITIENAHQSVTANPYVPFVAVAHRWFDKINLTIDVDIDGYFRGNSNRNFGANWDDRMDHMHYRYPVTFSISSANEVVYHFEHQFQDHTDESAFWLHGKPELQFQKFRATISVKTPDGSEIERKIIEVNENGRYQPGEKGAFSYAIAQRREDIPAVYETRSVTSLSSRAVASTVTRSVLIRPEVKNRYLLDFKFKLEEDMQYSRLTNRFYPWYGYVNKNRLRRMDFQPYFEDPDKLGFPFTRYFTVPIDEYRRDFGSIFSPTSGKSVDITDLDELIKLRSSPNTHRLLGNSYSDYLEGEHFEVQFVNIDNLNTNNWYRVSHNGNQWTVQTDYSKQVQLPWPKSLISDAILSANERGLQAYNTMYSESTRNLTARFKTRIDEENLSLPTLENGILDLSGDSLFEINTIYLTDGSPTLNLVGHLSREPGHSQYRLEPTSAQSLFISRLPRNWVTNSGSLHLGAPVLRGAPTDGQARLALHFRQEETPLRYLIIQILMFQRPFRNRTGKFHGQAFQI